MTSSITKTNNNGIEISTNSIPKTNKESSTVNAMSSTPKSNKQDQASNAIDDKTGLSQDFGQLVNNPQYSDVVFSLEGGTKRVYAHRIILAARSEMFRALLFGGMKESREAEIPLEEIKYEVFLQLLEFLYTGCLSFAESSVMELFAAANQYRIEALLMRCGMYLSDLNNEKNVCALLEMAHTYGESQLYAKCFHYIEQHTGSVVEDGSFLSLPEELVIKILQSDELQIDEASLFKALVAWGEHHRGLQQTDDLAHVLRNVMEHVRFPCMTPEDIVRVVKPLGIVSMEVLFEAMAYHASPASLDTCSQSSRKFTPRRFRKLRWELETKSKELQVDDMSVTVWRPGSIGCFPVVRTDEVFANGLVEIRIDSLPYKGNITSVGIGTLGAFFSTSRWSNGKSSCGKSQRKLWICQTCTTSW
eukprot:TRINITY_DN6012_c0_g1_i4.p1 TRINITY_DN6012_c0_g1~~TRINITY_DN6012_c0_g1_i4.p1  ORF type:complete len:418 (-),score=78.35 TRINITY_DN6012_c0_g1_i4:307-1560(-)